MYDETRRKCTFMIETKDNIIQKNDLHFSLSCVSFLKCLPFQIYML